MKDSSYLRFYYPSVGGAFRILISGINDTQFYIPQEYSLNHNEILFKNKFRKKLPLARLTKQLQKTDKLYCEWYKADNQLLKILKSYTPLLYDKYGNQFSISQFNRVINATKFIENKLNFYTVVKKINPHFLIPCHKTIRLKKTHHQVDFPYIIKSSSGKGGKGNLVCFQKKDVSLISDIFKSELFSKKQENGSYNKEQDVIVEPFLTNSKSYNISFYCDSLGKIHDVFISKQIIEEVFYRGNSAPVKISKKMHNSVMEFIIAFNQIIHHEYGFWGWMGLDFMIIQNHLYFLEANPRVNSVTHAHLLSKNNPFILRLVKTDSIKKLLSSFWWDKRKNIGLIPYQLFDRPMSLILSVATSYKEAQSQLTHFIKQNKLSYIHQRKIKGFSKSISYYLEHASHV